MKYRKWNIEKFKFEYYEIKGDIMVSTGIKDHKGREIYEGDVVRFKKGRSTGIDGEYQIKYVPDDGAFRAIRKDGSTYRVISLINADKGVEVISCKQNNSIDITNGEFKFKVRKIVEWLERVGCKETVVEMSEGGDGAGKFVAVDIVKQGEFSISITMYNNDSIQVSASTNSEVYTELLKTKASNMMNEEM